jgi:hypothetical protein
VAIKYDCHACKKQVTATKNNRYRSHSGGDGEPCEMASEPIPEHILAQPVGVDDDPSVPREGVDYATCPQCERKVKLTRLGYFEPHETTLRGGERCEVSGVRAKHARRLNDVLLPGDERPASAVPKVKDSETISRAPTSTNAGAASSPKELPPTSGTTGHAEPTWQEGRQIDWSKVGELKHLGTSIGTGICETSSKSPEPAPPAASSVSTETSSPESATTSKPSPGQPESTSSDAVEGPAAVGPFHLAPILGDGSILQPFSHILQPVSYEGPVKVVMGDLAKEIATKVKETFYSYSNRKSVDNRSAQTTLGPSEIGTPCDRRLAMSLMGVPPVNAGGDGWAAFVGTCTHTGMAEVYTFADAGTGRYAVELPVFLGVPTVPRGTTDLLDRRDGTVVDWKVMGVYSLKKFKAEGPSPTYRTQAHVYGLGAERGGEKVRNVAVVGLPRAGSSLDEMHVWTEKYDRKFAQDALARVERISNDVQARYPATSPSDVKPEMLVAETFFTADDCRYCPFHLKGDKEMKRGCPGK